MKSNTICANCNKQIYRTPCRIRPQNYCTSRCQMDYEYKTGKRNPNKTTEAAHEALRKRTRERFKTNPKININKRGYKMIYVPERQWVKLHHWIWEQKYGPVPKDKVLHHKNFNRLDNRIENLVLMEQRDHMKLHYAKRIIDKFGRFA